MRHPRILIAGFGLAAVAAAGGITAASAGGTPAISRPSASSAARATVRTAPATVGGRTETILVDAHGLPLYFYRPDTATKSLVTGDLARLWPPLTSAMATAAGPGGKLSVRTAANGHQVAYNGHFLYTFVNDHVGQVTGQGVQNFFVATPSLASKAGASAGADTGPAAPPGGLGY